MTTRTNTEAAFRARREGDGYLLYVPITGNYLYADRRTFEIVDKLRFTNLSGNGDVAELAELPGLSDGEAPVARSVFDVLAGRRERIGGPGKGSPTLCPLSDLIGDIADGCDTFGMPL